MGLSRFFIIFALFAALTNADSTSLIVKYRDSCDKLDIDSLLKNTVLVNAYVNCLLNKGPCTKYGKEVKSAIPEILSTTCANCSPNQKRIVQRVMHFMYTNRKSDFDALLDLYDPEKKYRTSMINFMAHADHVSDTQTSSNGTLHKVPVHSPRRTTKSIPSTLHQSSTAQPDATSHKPAHSLRTSRTPRFTQSSPKQTADPHRVTRKIHSTSTKHISSAQAESLS